MMRSLFAGVSGLKNHQTRMDVIGNNIANVNTNGFKGSRVTFQDLVCQNLSGASSAQGNRGGTNPMQIGLGMGTASIDTSFNDGSLQSTGRNTDLAISGAGFFILGDGANKVYTRSGAFEFDTEGNYVVPGSGLHVQGWMADANGNINTNGEIANIQVPKGQTMAAKPTTAVGFTKNLSAEGAWTGSSINLSGNTATLTNLGFTSMTVGSTVTKKENETEYEYEITAVDPVNDVISYKKTAKTASTSIASISAYDSEGVLHTITGTFTKTAANTWDFKPSGFTDTGYAITGGPFTIVFDTNGSVQSVNGNTTDLKGTFSFSPLQSSPVSVEIDFSKITQYSGESTVTMTSRDGYGAGSLDSVSLDSAGKIVGTFSNGQTKPLAQVAMAVFNNPSGLTKNGTNLYTESNNSGMAQITTAGNGGAGGLTPSNLEMSNVDLSEEFSNMIVTQRGFQANSKIITVSDEMLETLSNLKR